MSAKEEFLLEFVELLKKHRETLLSEDEFPTWEDLEIRMREIEDERKERKQRNAE